MGFKDYSEFMEPPLRLPYQGKVYVVPKPDVDRGLRLTRAVDAEGKSLYDADIEVQWTTVLGQAIYDEMVADDVPLEFIARAFVTALADFQLGREAAEGTWEVGSDPEALTAWFRARHPEDQATTPEQPASTSTDAESSTL